MRNSEPHKITTLRKTWITFSHNEKIKNINQNSSALRDVKETEFTFKTFAYHFNKRRECFCKREYELMYNLKQDIIQIILTSY